MNTEIFHSLVQCFKGTPMEAVMNTLNTRKFVELSNPVVKNKIIGEMSPLEKAIFSRLDFLDNKMKEQLAVLAASSGRDASERCFECPGYRMGLCPIIKEVREIREQFDDDAVPLKAILSQLVYERFGTTSSLVAKSFLLISTDENFKSTYKKNRRNRKSKGEKSDQELFEESIKGTFLETAINIMETGNFQDYDEPVAEGEDVITELNAFGKAMLTMVLKYHTEITAELEKFEALTKNNALAQLLAAENPLAQLLGGTGFEIMMFDMTDEKDLARAKEADAISEKLEKLMGNKQSLELIFHGMIETQIVSDIRDNKNQFGIRTGFKLVSIKN